MPHRCAHALVARATNLAVILCFQVLHVIQDVLDLDVLVDLVIQDVKVPEISLNCLDLCGKYCTAASIMQSISVGEWWCMHNWMSPQSGSQEVGRRRTVAEPMRWCTTMAHPRLDSIRRAHTYTRLVSHTTGSCPGHVPCV